MATSFGSILDANILSEDKLLEIYNSAVQHILDGKLLMSWGGEGSTATSQMTANPMDIAKEARYALKQKNPLKYGFLATTSRVIFY